MAKRRKSTLHSANRVTEAELLETTRALAADPELVMPHYEGGFLLFNPVLAAQRGIRKAHAARDDKAKLESMASRGNDYVKAYAAALLIAKADKLPFVADIRLPSGNVPYVMRGTAKPFFLAGLQHFHDPAIRLLSVAGWVKKRGLHFYSAKRGLVCSGKKDAPPRDFIEEQMAALGLVENEAGVFSCGHEEADAVTLDWRAAGIRIARCLECSAGTSSLHAIIKHIASPKPSSGFLPGARLIPLAVAAGEAPPEGFDMPGGLVQDYRQGRIQDAGLIEAARAMRVASLRRHAGRLYVAGHVSYGSDSEAFLAALKPTAAESRALHAALEAHDGPIVIERATTARALADLWPTHGLAMLTAAAGDAAIAERFHKDIVTPEETTDLVRRAAHDGAARVVNEALPKYARLPPAAETADLVARTYRVRGRDAAVRLALERAAQSKGKGVAWAILTRLDGIKGQEWRFAGADQEVASSLGAVVETLLDGAPESYHEALALTSKLSGETTTFSPQA